MSNNTTAQVVPIDPLIGVIPWLDKLLATGMTLILVFGSIFNILAFLYFQRRKLTPSTCVYRIVTLTDLVSCINVYPVILTLFSGRKAQFFENFYFRQFWGVTWEPMPYYSIFLVLVISVLRTLGMVRPLKRIQIKLVVGILTAYIVFLEIRFWLGMLAFGKYNYDPNASYCYIIIVYKWYQKLDLYLAITLYSLPIFPIILSSVVSICFLCIPALSPIKGSRSNRKRQATITVLIFTTIYIFCNIPVFITSVWFSILVFTEFGVSIIKPSHYMTYYNWVISYIILVQVNAGLNPVVYFLRMREFRTFILNHKNLQLARATTISGASSFRMNNISHLVTQATATVDSNLSQLRRKVQPISEETQVRPTDNGD